MRNYLKPLAYISLFLIITVLGRLSFIDEKFVVPLGVLITLAILAVVIFKTQGWGMVKMFFIVIMTISATLTLLWLLGVPNLPSPWNGIVIAVVTTFAILLSFLIMFKVNIFRLDSEEGRIYLK